MKKIMNVALVITLMCSIIAGVMIYKADRNFSNQQIAEYAAVKDHMYDDFDEVKVEITSTNKYDESYNGPTISFVIYEDGEIKYFRTISKDYYQKLMERDL